MPELPEVETMRRGVAILEGSRIESVAAPRNHLKPIRITPAIATLRRRLLQRTINVVGRVGKRVVFEMDTGDSLVLEPRMTGLVALSGPPDQDHVRLRVALVTKRGAQRELIFWDRRGLGSVRLLRASQFDQVLGLAKIGPDALRLTPRILEQQLAASRRHVKVALLDQRAVAGIGNLYASEILHTAAIHPLRRCNSLRGWEWKRLHAAIEHVLSEAIRYEGSTLADGTYRNALNQAGSYQNHHRVYARDRQTCLTCRQEQIIRVVQAQRSTFFCPSCQPRRPKSRKDCTTV